MRITVPTRLNSIGRKPPSLLALALPFLLSACTLSGLMALAMTPLRAHAEANHLLIYTVDVEGGQATLFVAPGGGSLLVDTGWPGNIHLVLGFTAPRDFIFRGELDDLKARNRNLSLTVTMSRPGDEPWSGPHRAR